MKKLLLAVLFGFVLGICIQAVRAASDTDTQIKDYQGRDKVQHMWFGVASASLCTAIDRKPGVFNMRCFATSEFAGFAEQIYALRTEPGKRRAEAGYDFLAHTIGATISTYTVQWLLVEPQKGGVKLTLTKSF